MNKLLLNPPVAFLIVLIFSSLAAFLFSKISYRSKNHPSGSRKAYACGENIADHMAQPDYSQFFPFAFFFMIAHVATLMLTTVPLETLETLVMAVIYICVVIIGLIVLFRR